MEAVGGDGGADRGAPVAPAGEQRVEPGRVHHRARENVAADFGGFFDNRYPNRRIALLEPDGGGEAGGSRPDDQYIGRHALAVVGFGHRSLLEVGNGNALVP